MALLPIIFLFMPVGHIATAQDLCHSAHAAEINGRIIQLCSKDIQHMHTCYWLKSWVWVRVR